MITIGLVHLCGFDSALGSQEEQRLLCTHTHFTVVVLIYTNVQNLLGCWSYFLLHRTMRVV